MSISAQIDGARATYTRVFTTEPYGIALAQSQIDELIESRLAPHYLRLVNGELTYRGLRIFRFVDQDIVGPNVFGETAADELRRAGLAFPVN